MCYAAAPDWGELAEQIPRAGSRRRMGSMFMIKIDRQPSLAWESHAGQ